jgi:hypothetical protein
MPNQQIKACKEYHVPQKYEEFLDEKGVALKKCLKYRNKLKTNSIKK